MPIGPDYNPRGFQPEQNPSFFDRFLLAVGAVFGAVLAGAQALASGLIRAIVQQVNDEFPAAPLTPEAAAAGLVKNAVPGADWSGEARLSGMSPERFNALAALTGNPPGPEELLAAWRRSIIDDAGLDHGLRQGYLKDEWIGFFHALRFLPISVADAVTAVVQGHMPYDEGEAVANGQGVDRDMFRVLFDTAGNPPGPQEVLTMWRRGIVDEATVDQALRESRLKDKYIPALKALYRVRVPMRTITTLVRHGALSESQALTDLEQLGYTAEDAQAIIKAAGASATAAHKDLSVSTIKSLYEDRLVSRDQAVADLGTAGYPAGVAGQLLDLADATAVQRLRAAAITKVRSLYVGHRIDATTVRADLAAMSMPADQIAYSVELWTLEREQNLVQLTEAQLRLAVGAGLLTVAGYTARLVERGYSPADADLLARAHGLAP